MVIKSACFAWLLQVEWLGCLVACFHFLIACNGRKASVAIFAVKGACDEIVEGIA